jgi:riboflavin biosynthesis pyrimidine reductase
MQPYLMWTPGSLSGTSTGDVQGASPAPTVAQWAAAYAYPDDLPDGWWLRGNMVATVDGAAVGPDGVTRAISSDEDRELLALLRALSDVILVGASTAMAEGYGPERVNPEYAHLRAAAGQAPIPAIAVVSNRLDLDLDSPLFAEAAAPTILLTVADAPSDQLRAARSKGSRLDVVIVGRTVVDPAMAVAALVERGHRRLLCEGGPRWLSALVEADLLDELCLTVSPRLLGGDAFRILRNASLGDGLAVRLGHVCSDGASLFLRYTRLRRAEGEQ